ncbi:MAG: phosphate ABC transporter substrate-binding protein PstS [Methanobacteriota archaeon]|nr:MAG: phosphate ABC transporter substrate-binding protein PstS [Euryarchaeota archaeon]
MTDQTKKIIIGTAVVVGIVALLFLPALFSSRAVTLNGAGSTFVNPLMSTWSDYYTANVSSDVEVNYASIGSGGGIRQLLNKTVDFAASDAPMNAEEFASAKNVLHIPITVGAVVVAFNIPGINDLKMTGEVVADIFLGKITKWNDPAIAALNPDVTLPSEDIIVAHRSDGSGTTFVFTDYLSHVSTDWKEQKGTGKSIDWAVGLGGKGNEGVTKLILDNEYSIGYIELSYSETNNLNTVKLQNQAGEFVSPSIQNIKNAVNNAAASLPKGDESWEDVSIVDAPGSGSYPIVSFVYLMVYKDLNNVEDKEVAQALVDFIWWIVHDGQSFAEPLYYVGLADTVISLNENTIGMINFNGESLVLPSS